MAYLDRVRTASQVLNENSDHDAQNALLQDERDAAAAAGVTHSEYINYAAKMTNYASRDDVEPLSERRARDIGLVADQTFRREGTGSIAVITSPGDQNVG
jgi:hypothetical protein